MTPSGVVGLVGAGNLGRRHLAGLLDSELVEVVHICDISRDSLTACEEVVHLASRGVPTRVDTEVHLHSAISAFPERLELVVVATSADVRPGVVEEISAHTDVRNYVLEKVLAQHQSGFSRLVVATMGSNAWVNIPRRMMRWHRRLRSRIYGNGQIAMEVVGGDWGMACNGVHFIDLLEWWSGEAPETIDTSELEPEWRAAKRDGFMEVYGSVVVSFSGGSRLLLSSSPGPETITIGLDVAGMSWYINEREGTANRSDGLSQSGVLENQTSMTPRLVDSILGSGKCSLPTLRDSIRGHEVLLEGLMEHWVQSGGSRTGVPIT
jgi:hypothetical protein